MRHRNLFPVALAVLVLSSPLSASAQDAYKCKINGAYVYQDRPCPGAVRYSADLPAANKGAPQTAPDGQAKAAPPDDLERNKAFLKESAKSRRIADLKFDIERADEELAAVHVRLDQELAALRYQKSTSNNNLAGATWEQSIATEMQAVTSRYEIDIANRREKIKRLRAELEEVKQSK